MSEKLQKLVERKDRRKLRDFLYNATKKKKLDGEKVVKERKKQFLKSDFRKM